MLWINVENIEAGNSAGSNAYKRPSGPPFSIKEFMMNNTGLKKITTLLAAQKGAQLCAMGYGRIEKQVIDGRAERVLTTNSGSPQVIIAPKFDYLFVVPAKVPGNT